MVMELRQIRPLRTNPLVHDLIVFTLGRAILVGLLSASLLRM